MHMSPSLKSRRGRFSRSPPTIRIASPVPNDSSPLQYRIVKAAGSPLGSPLGSPIHEGSPVQVAIKVKGRAFDGYGGNISQRIRWNSSINGLVGKHANPTILLSVGTHTLTASVADSAGATASDSITITVARP